MTSEMPSRYQSGVVRYIGGQTNTWRDERSDPKELILSQNFDRMDAMRSEIEDATGEDVKKFEMQATTQASESEATELNVPDRSDSFPQLRTFADDIGCLPLMLVGVM